jgi:hypothetical protein
MATILNASSDGIKKIITKADQQLSIGNTVLPSESTSATILHMEGFLRSYAAIEMEIHRGNNQDKLLEVETVWVLLHLLKILCDLQKEAYQAYLQHHFLTCYHDLPPWETPPTTLHDAQRLQMESDL